MESSSIGYANVWDVLLDASTDADLFHTTTIPTITPTSQTTTTTTTTTTPPPTTTATTSTISTSTPSTTSTTTTALLNTTTHLNTPSAVSDAVCKRCVRILSAVCEKVGVSRGVVIHALFILHR